MQTYVYTHMCATHIHMCQCTCESGWLESAQHTLVGSTSRCVLEVSCRTPVFRCAPPPIPHHLPQDLAKEQLLMVLEHGACDSESCLHAISVSLGGAHIQLRDSGSLGSQGTYLQPKELWLRC